MSLTQHAMNATVHDHQQSMYHRFAAIQRALFPFISEQLKSPWHSAVRRNDSLRSSRSSSFVTLDIRTFGRVAGENNDWVNDVSQHAGSHMFVVLAVLHSNMYNYVTDNSAYPPRLLMAQNRCY